MGIITLKNDGSQDQLTLPGLDHPKLYSTIEASRRIRYILSHFDETFKTESSMYLTFRRLEKADREFLMGYWGHDDEFKTFLHLCSYYQVKVA